MLFKYPPGCIYRSLGIVRTTPGANKTFESRNLGRFAVCVAMSFSLDEHYFEESPRCTTSKFLCPIELFCSAMLNENSSFPVKATDL